MKNTRERTMIPSVRLSSVLPTVALLAMAACGGGEPGGDPGATAAAGGEVEAAGPRDLQATSFLGRELRRSELDPGSWALQDSLLAVAEAELEARPDDPMALIWVGRRLGYLGRYDEAIEVYTQGVERFPEDARFLRHRGHRYISIRELDRAISDLAAAWALEQDREDRVEPDGLPNARGIPTSTLHSNIRYHLGLAHYLNGDFAAARGPYQADVDASANPDMLVASSYWLYMILRRLGEDEEAAQVLAGISEDMDIIENTAYHELLLLHKGVRTESDFVSEGEGVSLQGTTTAYGLGVWYLFQDRDDDARAAFESILEGRAQWPAFGYIAAEAEMARWPQP
jgi:tetratricopeptide (TPR) repeat protein